MFSWSCVSLVCQLLWYLRSSNKTGFFIIRASVPRFIPLKSGMPSRGKRIGRAQSISLFSPVHSVSVCAREGVWVCYECVSACKVWCEDALLSVSSELFMSGENCKLCFEWFAHKSFSDCLCVYREWWKRDVLIPHILAQNWLLNIRWLVSRWSV